MEDSKRWKKKDKPCVSILRRNEQHLRQTFIPDLGVGFQSEISVSHSGFDLFHFTL